MSFMDELGKMAGGIFQNASPQQTADAASDHVANADPGQLADHLSESVGTMDQGSVAALGAQLLHAFTNTPNAEDAGAAADSAGTSQADVAAGDPNAVSNLIQYAKNNPQVLQTAATAFMQRNPSAIMSMAPGLLQGIMGRFGGGNASGTPANAGDGSDS